MATTCDKDAVREAYNTVRDDKNETNWAVFKYEGNMITLGSTGTDYEGFLANLDCNISQIKPSYYDYSYLTYTIFFSSYSTFIRLFAYIHRR